MFMSIAIAALLLRNTNAVGCYPAWSSGSAYSSGSLVSATQVVDATVGTTVTKNFECTSGSEPALSHCPTYDPSNPLQAAATWSEQGECFKSETIETDSPTSKPTHAGWSGVGCPKAWVDGSSYESGEMAEVDGLAYKCSDVAFVHTWCGDSNYKPGDSLYWKQAWTLLGSCDGTIAPTSSPVYVSLTDAGGCPNEYVAGSTYEENDKVALNGIVYKCRTWPYSARCSMDGFGPNSANSEDAWILVGFCDGTQSPTTSPVFIALEDHGGCPGQYVAGTDYQANQKVSVPINDNDSFVYECSGDVHESRYCNIFHPDNAWHLGWTLIARCDGTMAPTTAPNFERLQEIIGDDCPGEYNAATEYEPGDKVSIFADDESDQVVVFECKQWPFGAYCNAGITFGPGSDYGSMGWEMKGYCDVSVCLYNIDFVDGTFIISTPSSSWKLCEDIAFCPSNIVNVQNPTDEEIAESFDPQVQGLGAYTTQEYGLGFFAAVAIQAHDVSFFLNGYHIEQCAEHALMQRFFAVFELASAPFTKSTGPHDFVTGDSDNFVAATNFKLRGPGTIGRSAHHSIHGNDNVNVEISGITFADFEVGAVSLNNVKGLKITNCDIPHNRHDVPVLGIFSAALQIRPFLKYLKELQPSNSMLLGGAVKTVEEVYDALVSSIASVYKDVKEYGFIQEDNPNYFLFNNPHKVIDGPCYGFLVHGKGPAVGGFGEVMATDTSLLSADVYITDNHVENIKCFTNEILAVVLEDKVMNDARGSILQFYNGAVHTGVVDAEAPAVGKLYVGNVILDAQVMTAKALMDGVFADPLISYILQPQVNSVSTALIEWAQGSVALDLQFRCNGDSMHHVIKGSIMVRIEDCQGFEVRGNIIKNVEVLSEAASANADMCDDYHLGASSEDGSDRMLADIRGISVAAVSGFEDKESSISNNFILDFKSESANKIIGIDIQGVSSGVNITSNYVDLNSSVGVNDNDKWIGLRIRETADAIFTKSNNDFLQGELDLADRRKLMPSYHPEYVTEWPNNGCPFGH